MVRRLSFIPMCCQSAPQCKLFGAQEHNYVLKDDSYNSRRHTMATNGADMAQEEVCDLDRPLETGKMGSDLSIVTLHGFAVAQVPKTRVSLGNCVVSKKELIALPPPSLPLLERDADTLSNNTISSSLLDLPTEILLYIINHLILRPGHGSWIASGSNRVSENSPKLDNCPREKWSFFDGTVSLSPNSSSLVIEHGLITDTARSLLMTNRYMRALTSQALITCFSGILKLKTTENSARQRSPWLDLTSRSPFVLQNQLLFLNVEQLEMDYSCETWPDLSNVMPKLRRIKMAASSEVRYPLLGPDEIIDGGVFSDDRYDFDHRSHPFHGLHDAGIIQVGTDSAINWIEWCKSEEQQRSDTGRGLEMAVVVRLGAAWDHPWVEWVSTTDSHILFFRYRARVVSLMQAR